ncbi:tetratricopeptide repeat protein (plasmid) [Pseudoalteromonas sp. T1lg65]|uniref:tetratricopeptide repeat protein n=1 Tax=Pseudoalteromonas sp. T1lg65 TaxID=2077101 RepID=UPI003F799506
MNTFFLLLFSTIFTTADYENFKQAIATEPDRAFEIYNRVISEPSLDVLTRYRLHNGVIQAATYSDRNEELLEAVAALQSTEFKDYLLHDQYKLVTNIGLGYWRRKQLDSATVHLQCALAKTDDQILKMVIKLNLSVIFSEKEQPAQAYALLSGVEPTAVPEYAKGELQVALGNSAVAGGEVERAIAHYHESLVYFKEQDKAIPRAIVYLNLLGLYLMQSNEQGYQLALTEIKSHPELANTITAYLVWIDMLHQGNVDKMNTEQLTALANKATQEGMFDHLKLQISHFKLPVAYLEPRKLQVSATPLPKLLGKQWCDNL